MLNKDTILTQATDSFQTIVKVDTIVLKDTITHTVNDTVTKIITNVDTLKQTVLKPVDDGIQFVAQHSEQTIPVLLIIGLLVLGGTIWLTFKILGDYITPFLKSKYNIKRAYLFVYRLQIITWFVYTLFCFYQLVSSSLTIGLVLTIFIAVIGFNFWKDFFAGVYLKFSGNLNTNDYISINRLKGKLLKFNARNIQIETENDEIMYVPYRQFLENEVSKKLNKGELRSKKIVLNLSDDNPNNNLSKIKQIVVLCPWVNSHKPIKVEKNNNNSFEVTVYASDDFTFNKIQTYLKEKTG
jgi:hypothetical protein